MPPQEICFRNKEMSDLPYESSEIGKSVIFDYIDGAIKVY